MEKERVNQSPKRPTLILARFYHMYRIGPRVVVIAVR